MSDKEVGPGGGVGLPSIAFFRADGPHTDVLDSKLKE
jgi:hypothetical protein